MGKMIDVLVSSGAKVSADIDLREGQLAAIFVPTITSGDMYIQGGFDTTSALFTRLHNENGDIYFPTGAGSRMVLWHLAEMTPSYARVEFANAQTDNRSLIALRF